MEYREGLITDHDRIVAGTTSRAWSVIWWKAIGVFAAAIIIGLGFVKLTPFLAQSFALLFIAISISAAISPLITRVSRILPRRLSIMVVYLALTLLIVVTVATLIVPLLSQLPSFIEEIPSFVSNIQHTVNEQLGENEAIASFLDRFASEIAQVGQSVISVPVSAVNAIFNIVLVLIVSLYILIAAPQVQQFFLSFFAPKDQQHVKDVTSDIVTAMGGYIHAVIFNMVIVSIMTTIGLMVIGLPYAPLLGVLAGLLEALPTIGSLIAAAPILLVAALQSLPTLGITLAFVLIVQQIQGNVISPIVLQKQLSVPRFLIPIVIIAGGTLMGVLGALIAVPVVAVLQIIFMREVVPRIRQKTGATSDIVSESEAHDFDSGK